MITVRRRLISTSVIALLTSSFLVGCGTDTTDSTDLLPAAEGTTQYPLTLSTWAGETVLDERPERIAVIGFSPNYDALESLDAVPVYALSDDLEREYNDPSFRERIEFIDPATRRDPLNMENIAASDPDMIIATNFVTD